MFVKLRKGRTALPVTNFTDIKISLDKDRNVATLKLYSFIGSTQPLSPDDLMHISPKHEQNLHVQTAPPICENDKSSVIKANLEKYPHLCPEDPLVSLTEEEIFRKQVDLSKSILHKNEIEDTYRFLQTNREAFSLYGELSSCPNFEVDVRLTNDDHSSSSHTLQQKKTNS
jgi:hypothetical protein